MPVPAAAPDRTRPTAEQSFARWKTYKATGDIEIRNRLVLTYLPLIRHLVYRKLRELPATCEREELISCGIEALITALDRYDPEKGASLEPYLWTRIHGSVLDSLRRRDWAPRSLRHFERDVRAAREKFTAINGRHPSDDELGVVLGMTGQQLRDKEREAANAAVSSLSALVSTSEENTAVEVVETLESSDLDSDPETVTTRQMAKERFREAFELLPQREREVAVLLYVKELTLREIGDVLGVSESRVSQLHSQLRRRIAEHLTEDRALFLELA